MKKVMFFVLFVMSAIVNAKEDITKYMYFDCRMVQDVIIPVIKNGSACMVFIPNKGGKEFEHIMKTTDFCKKYDLKKNEMEKVFKYTEDIILTQCLLMNKENAQLTGMALDRIKDIEMKRKTK